MDPKSPALRRDGARIAQLSQTTVLGRQCDAGTASCRARFKICHKTTPSRLTMMVRRNISVDIIVHRT